MSSPDDDRATPQFQNSHLGVAFFGAQLAAEAKSARFHTQLVNRPG